MPPRRVLKPVTVVGGAAGGKWLEGFVGHLQNECHLAENTVAAYRRDVERLFDWLGGRSLAALSIRDLADYATWLHRRKLAPASIARHIVSLKLFSRYLQLEGVLRDNLAELLGSQKLWQRVPHVLSPAQVDQLLAAPCRSDAHWRRDRAFLELLYASGCRASEMSGLTLSDVHLDDGYAVCHGKGDKQRLVPLGRRAIAAVREYLEHERPELVAAVPAAAAPWLLVSRRGRRLRRERIWELFKRVCRPGRHRSAAQPALAAAQLRHALARRGGRSAASARNARARQHRHHADLHPRRPGPAQGGPPAISPAGVRVR